MPEMEIYGIGNVENKKKNILNATWKMEFPILRHMKFGALVSGYLSWKTSHPRRTPPAESISCPH